MVANSAPDREVFAKRRQRLVGQLDGQSLLVSNLVNVRYLTGFTGSNAFLLISESVEILLTDGRYVQQVAVESPDLETRIRSVDSTMIALIAEALNESNVTTCQVESDSMSRALWRDLGEVTSGQTELLDSSGQVEQLLSLIHI